MIAMNRNMLLVLVAFGAMFAFQVEAVPRKTVIWHGWDMLKVTTEDVWRNRTKFADAGCDGILFPLSRMTEKGKFVKAREVFAPESYCDADYARAVELARECLKEDGLRESLAFFMMIPPKRLSWTDDASWAHACSNVAVIARAAKKAGFRGLAIDNEDYTKQRQFMFRDEDPDVPVVQDLARRRGREFFQTLFREFPDATVLSFWSFSDKDWMVRAPDSKYAQSIGGFLWMSFLDGMLDAIPPGARFVSGNEENGYRCDGDEDAFRVWRDLSTRGSIAMASPENRAKFLTQVSVSFGQYVDMSILPEGHRWYRPPLDGSRMRRFQRNLAAATAIADDLIWVYGERGTIIDWDEKYHPFLEYPTCDAQLPGFAQALRTAGGDLTSFRALADKGLLKRLTVDAADPVSLTNNATKTVVCTDRVHAGDVVYLRLKKTGPYPSVSVRWTKDGHPVKVSGSGLLIPTAGGETGADGVLDERFVVPEGTDGLNILLGAPWAKRANVTYRDIELFVFEQKGEK